MQARLEVEQFNEPGLTWNIILGLKWLTMTNTVAYNGTELIRWIKVLYPRPLGGNWEWPKDIPISVITETFCRLHQIGVGGQFLTIFCHSFFFLFFGATHFHRLDISSVCHCICWTFYQLGFSSTCSFIKLLFLHFAVAST